MIALVNEGVRWVAITFCCSLTMCVVDDRGPVVCTDDQHACIEPMEVPGGSECWFKVTETVP